MHLELTGGVETCDWKGQSYAWPLGRVSPGGHSNWVLHPLPVRIFLLLAGRVSASQKSNLHLQRALWGTPLNIQHGNLENLNTKKQEEGVATELWGVVCKRVLWKTLSFHLLPQILALMKSYLNIYSPGDAACFLFSWCLSLCFWL